MSNFFVVIFLISVIVLIVFLVKSEFRTKKNIWPVILSIFLSFCLIGITATSEEAGQKVKEEQVVKEKAAAEKKAKEEQVAKEKATADQRAKEKRVAKEKAAADQRAKEERVAEEKAAADQRAKEERVAEEKAAADQRAKEERVAEERAESEKNVSPQTNGITGLCKDGSSASGDPSARGKANSCYGHGGWVR